MKKSGYHRVRARVVRAGPYTAHVAVDSFVSGQITIPVPTQTLSDATGLSRDRLAGAELTATANTGARTDSEVCPHNWQLRGLDDRFPPA